MASAYLGLGLALFSLSVGVACSSGSTGAGAGGSDGGAQGDDEASVDGGGGGTEGGPSGTETLITEPDQGMTPIYDFIGSATKTLDMTMYELTDTKVTGMLTAAAKSGVTVRVLLDQNLEQSNNTTAYNALSSGGVKVEWAPPGYAATHQKTITVDGATSAVMTINLTPEYYSTGRDFAVLTTDAVDVAAIEAVFQADYGNAAITPSNGDDLVWSPTGSEAALVGVINGAKTTLIVENEEMSDSDIISALSSAASRGVAVQVVMTASKSWDSAFTTLKAAGVKVVTYAQSAPLYIHAKVMLADYGTAGANAFVGSENFSSASLTKNRELGITTTNATILDSLQKTLASDFAGGTAY